MVTGIEHTAIASPDPHRLADWYVEVADRLIEAISERFWRLGEYPDAGRSCEDLMPGARCFPVGKYLIYYSKMRRGVEIFHIVHGARRRPTPAP